MVKIDKFDGGISKRIDSGLTKLNTSVYLNNADVSTGVIRSITKPKMEKALKGTFLDINRGKFIEYEDLRSTVEFEGNLYYSRDRSSPDDVTSRAGSRVFLKDKEYKLGLDKPVNRSFSSDDFNATALEGIQAIGDDAPLDLYVQADYITMTGGRNHVDDKDTDKYIEYKYGAMLSSYGKPFSRFSMKDAWFLKSSIESERQVLFTIQGSKQYEGITLDIFRKYKGVYWSIKVIDLGKEQTTFTDYTGTQDSFIRKHTFWNVPHSSTIEGSYQYTETFYSYITGYESPPSNFSSLFDIKAPPPPPEHPDRIINIFCPKLTNFAKCPANISDVTHRRIYRMGNTLKQMTMIAELPILDTCSLDFHFFDFYRDSDATRILSSYENYPPVKTMKFLTEYRGIFFGIVDNELRFSKIGEPNAFPPQNSLRLRAEGTGLLSCGQGLLVFTQSSTYILKGTELKNFELSLLSDELGCTTHQSCALLNSITPVWVSSLGICTLESNRIKNISAPYLGETDLKARQGLAMNNQYFILIDGGKILVLDTRSGFRFYEIHDLGTVPDDWMQITYMAVDKQTSRIYYVGRRQDDNKYYIYSNSKRHYLGVHDRIEDYAYTSYHSPTFVDGGHTRLKMYEKVFVRLDGEFNCKVYMDGKFVCAETMKGENKVFVINIPASEQRKYSCNFAFYGRGIIYSIETKQTGGKNGA